MTELAKKSSDGNESKSECCKPIISLTNEKIDEILIPILFGEEGMALPDGSSLMGQIVYSQNSKLSKSREKIKSLIHQAEIKAELDSLRWAEHNSNDVNFSIADRIEALEKEIV